MYELYIERERELKFNDCQNLNVLFNFFVGILQIFLSEDNIV